MLRKLCLLPAVALLAVTPSAHAATPGFSADQAPRVGAPTTLSTDADCTTSRCDWSVWVPNRYGQLVAGGGLGSGAAVVWVPAVSLASRAYVVIALKVTAPGPTANFTLAQRSFVVTP